MKYLGYFARVTCPVCHGKGSVWYQPTKKELNSDFAHYTGWKTCGSCVNGVREVSIPKPQPEIRYQYVPAPKPKSCVEIGIEAGIPWTMPPEPKKVHCPLDNLDDMQYIRRKPIRRRRKIK